MEKTKPLKPSIMLYGEDPITWAFLPYYIASEHKMALADKKLGTELEKGYMVQDNEVVNRELAAKNFNSDLIGEMDSAMIRNNIHNKRAMLEELKDAYLHIVSKYMKDNG